METATASAKNATNDVEIELLNQKRQALQEEVAGVEARLAQLRTENNDAGGKASNIVQNSRKSKLLRTARRVLGYSLAVGGTVVVGAYIYNRLRSHGVDVPDGQAIGDGVASVIDMATA